MRLDDCYRIESDTYNVVLRFECHTGELNEKTGKEIISTNEWYYPNIKAALISYLHKFVATDIGKKTAEEVLVSIKEVEDIINER